MKILGIETSCDETAAAVVENGNHVVSSVISSQIAKHACYGGVIPELAAREHLAAIQPVVAQAMAEAQCSFADLSGVAVTAAPGLVPALLVGVTAAKGIATAAHKPLIGVNHFLGHIYGAFLENTEQLEQSETYPILAMVVSGGHTALVLITEDGQSHLLGSTIDDAAGEAFDKAAKIMNLGYPGGPIIDRLAAQGNPKAYHFPRPLTGTTGKAVPEEHLYNFSFSGVKTSLLYAVKDRQLSEQEIADVAASYQEAIVEVLTKKAMMACRQYRVRTVLASGGVACNRGLRQALEAACKTHQCRFVVAPPKYCTDNAAMIAGVGFHYLRKGILTDDRLAVNARLSLNLGQIPWDLPKK